jgi:hypothetical protein
MVKCTKCFGIGYIFRSLSKTTASQYEVQLAVAECSYDKLKDCELCNGEGHLSGNRLAAYRLAGADAALMIPAHE